MNLRFLSLALFVFLVTPLTAEAKPTDKPVSTATPKPLAQTLTGDAKIDYDAARLLAGDGDFAGAFLRFQSAFDKSHDARLLWNLAACQKSLRHYSKVIDLVKRYLAEGGPLLTAQDRKDAADLTQALDTFTTLAKIDVSEAGAEIFVDDDRIGVSPIPERVRIDVGNRRVRAKKEGFLDFDKNLPVGGAPEVSVDVKLEKEVHEGKLSIVAPPNAHILVDGKSVGEGKAELTIATGGHTLRVTAPGMHPYEREVAMRDNEARAVEVTLEKEPEPELPRLRVAVGCGSREPLRPELLRVYLDSGSPLPPGAVKESWSEAENRTVVDYVSYPVPAGRYHARVWSEGCGMLEIEVPVSAPSGADISGRLPGDALLSFGHTANPAWLRVGVGVLATGTGQRSRWSGDCPSSSGICGGYTEANSLGLAGLLSLAVVQRWWTIGADVAVGSHSGSTSGYVADNFNAGLGTVTYVDVRGQVKAGVRLPLGVLAFAGGAGLAVHDTIPSVVSGPVTVNSPVTTVDLMAFPWLAIDVQPLCDFGISVMGQVEGKLAGSNFDYYSHPLLPLVGTQLYYQPSPKCREERAAGSGLRSGR